MDRSGLKELGSPLKDYRLQEIFNQNFDGRCWRLLRCGPIYGCSEPYPQSDFVLAMERYTLHFHVH